MKRIWLRIIVFLSLGMFLSLLYMSGIVIFLMEVVIARVNISDSWTTVAVWAAMIFPWQPAGCPHGTLFSFGEQTHHGRPVCPG